MDLKAILTSTTAKLLAVTLIVAALQSFASYLKTDTSPTFAEGLNAIGSGVVGAFLYWLRGPQDPIAKE